MQSIAATNLTTHLELYLIEASGPPQSRLTLDDRLRVTAIATAVGSMTGAVIGDHVVANGVVGFACGSVISLVYCVRAALSIG